MHWLVPATVVGVYVLREPLQRAATRAKTCISLRKQDAVHYAPDAPRPQPLRWSLGRQRTSHRTYDDGACTED